MGLPLEDEESSSIGDTHTLLNEHQKTEPYPKDKRSLRSVFWAILSFINIFVFGFNLFRIFIPYSSRGGEKVNDVRLKTYDFTKDAIKLEIRPFQDTFGDNEHSLFRGNPRPELDAAWLGMVQGYNIRVPPSVWIPDATPNHTLVELPDESGDHYAVVAAIHDLHCLKTLREYLIPEDYPTIYEMFKPKPGEKIGIHIDHCIDVLRQSAMCHADMTLLPFEWWEHNPIPQNIIHTPHLCANWEMVQDWAIKHSFNPVGFLFGHDHGHHHN